MKRGITLVCSLLLFACGGATEEPAEQESSSGAEMAVADTAETPEASWSVRGEDEPMNHAIRAALLAGLRCSGLTPVEIEPMHAALEAVTGEEWGYPADEEVPTVLDATDTRIHASGVTVADPSGGYVAMVRIIWGENERWLDTVRGATPEELASGVQALLTSQLASQGLAEDAECPGAE